MRTPRQPMPACSRRKAAGWRKSFCLNSLSLACLCASAALIMPARAETLVGPYPFAVGDKFIFDYNSTDTVTIDGTPTVTTVSYTSTTTVLAAVKYNYPPSGGTVTAYPFQTTGTWSDSTGTHTLKSIEYRNFVTSGSTTSYLIYGYATTTNVAEAGNITLHNVQTRVYGSPGVLDKIPEVTGATFAQPVAWTETNDNYYITSSGNSNVYNDKYAGKSTGAFTAAGVSYDVPFSIVQDANGTGTYTIGPSTSQEEWSFGLPESSSKGEIIPVTVLFDGKTGLNDAADWYPGGGAPSNPLTTNRGEDKGTAVIPKGCGKYAGKSARLIELTYNHLDTVNGFTLDEVQDYYVINKIGRACETVNSTRTNYDAQVSGLETSTETFSSSLGLISETVK